MIEEKPIFCVTLGERHYQARRYGRPPDVPKSLEERKHKPNSIYIATAVVIHKITPFSSIFFKSQRY